MANFNPTYYQQQASQIQSGKTKSTFNYFVARVTHVVQGPNYLGTNIPDPYYNNPTDIGVITFQLLPGTQDRTLQSAGNVTAKPMYASVKQMPLEGEFVLIFPGPGLRMNESRNQPDYYYSLVYNLWNASHHNALPDLGDYGAYVQDVKRTYENSSTVNQATNTSATGSTTMPLGPNFFEKSNIKALRPFTGDVTIEGRWGNSIRFSSTNNIPPDQNPWSRNSTPGNPITIIRNGQGRQENDLAWFPTVENINTDPSSIYLTQGQEIIIDDINNNFSLASLDVALQSTVTIAIPIQQQLTSIDTISPLQQDQAIDQISQPAPIGPGVVVNNVTSNAPTVNIPANATGVVTSVQAVNQVPQPTPIGPGVVVNNVTNSTSTVNIPANATRTITPAQAVRVVGELIDLKAVFGTYQVNLRAVDSTGTILSSVSETATTAQVAYSTAVTAIKNKNPNTSLIIPSFNSLSR